MNGFTALTVRNLRVYLRDRTAVFFSLLSMLIVIMLMLCFLGDMNTNAITDLLSVLPDRDAEKDRANAELLIFAWTSAGIICINAATVTLSVLSAMIKDRENGTLNAIYTSPVSRAAIAASYVVSAWIASVFICSATLAITEIYCVNSGMAAFTFKEHMILLGMIMANSFTYASIMYVLTFAAKSQASWSGIGTIISTLVGFLGGIYLPVGSLSETVNNVLRCTPVIYGSVIFRNVMTDSVISETFSGAPDEMISAYREVMGISLEAFGTDITPLSGTLILIICGAVFLAAGAAAAAVTGKSDR